MSLRRRAAPSVVSTPRSRTSQAIAEATSASSPALVRGGSAWVMRRIIRRPQTGRIDFATFVDLPGFLPEKAWIEAVSIPLFFGERLAAPEADRHTRACSHANEYAPAFR